MKAASGSPSPMRGSCEPTTELVFRPSDMGVLVGVHTHDDPARSAMCQARCRHPLLRSGEVGGGPTGRVDSTAMGLDARLLSGHCSSGWSLIGDRAPEPTDRNQGTRPVT